MLRWYVLRMMDGSDEPLGLVALGACLWFAWREPHHGISPRRLALAAFGLALLALAPTETPPLFRALVWVSALAALTARSLARAGLLAYSLPVMASAQFFAGYPVRVAVTWAASGLLRLLGFAVSPSATVLVWHRERVLIDAPCSGLQMAWLAGLLALVLANLYSLRAKSTLNLIAFCAGVTFAANALRAAILFLLETQLRVCAEWMHDAVGLVLFAAVVGIVLARASSIRDHVNQSKIDFPAWLSGRSEETESAGSAWLCLCRKIVCATHSVGVRGRFAIVAVFVFSAGLGAARPLCDSRPLNSNEPKPTVFPGWETAPIEPSLRQVPLDAKTLRFAADFPGKLAIFSDGRRTWIVRWVYRPTRKLHSSSDCLRAAGYRVVPGRAQLDGQNALWSSFDAKRDGEDLRVCERIVGARGAAWTDVSAWFWETFFDSDSGPWWAITKLEPR